MYPYRQFNAALGIIIANVAVFLLTSLTRQLQLYLALNPVLIVRELFLWQPLTYMFAHGSIGHIAFNMLGVLFFGTQLERRMGSTEFLVYYLVSGVGAGLLSLGIFWITGSFNVLLVGASGAVYAVLLAFATFYPDATIYVFGILPVPAPLLVIGFTVIELFSQLTGGRGNTAHITHLAGFLVGFLWLTFRIGVNPINVFSGRDRV